MSRAGGTCHREEEFIFDVVGGGVVVQSCAHSLEEENHVAGLGCVGWVLPIHVKTVEA